MNAQMMDNLFVESYMMMNFEITFSGVRAWFEMSNAQMDDVLHCTRNLFFPEQISHERPGRNDANGHLSLRRRFLSGQPGR